jgi:hypothetical protein
MEVEMAGKVILPVPGTKITAVEVRSFTMFEQLVPVILGDDGFVYVEFAALCQLLQLDAAEQVQHIDDHAVMQTGLAYRIIEEKVEFLLRTDLLALWLTHLRGDDLPHIRHREEIEAYQHEAALVLAESLLGGRLTHWPLISKLLEQDTPTVRVYKESVALLGQVRERLIEESQLRLPPEYRADFSCDDGTINKFGDDR